MNLGIGVVRKRASNCLIYRYLKIKHIFRYIIHILYNSETSMVRERTLWCCRIPSPLTIFQGSNMKRHYEYHCFLYLERTASVSALCRGMRSVQLSARFPLVQTRSHLIPMEISTCAGEGIHGALVFVSHGRRRLVGMPHAVPAVLPLVASQQRTAGLLLHAASRSIRQHRGSHDRSHFEFPPLLPLYSLSSTSGTTHVLKQPAASARAPGSSTFLQQLGSVKECHQDTSP